MSDLSIELHWQRAEPELATGQVLERTYRAVTTDSYDVQVDAAPDWGGDPANTNPEQALASALSSCHMMTFLALAAKAGWPVASYHDYAVAHLGKNAKGQMSVTRIDLHPVVRFDTGFSVERGGDGKDAGPRASLLLHRQHAGRQRRNQHSLAPTKDQPVHSNDILLRDLDDDGILRLTLNDAGAAQCPVRGDAGRNWAPPLPRPASDPSVRVVILAANGPAFCAGHDLKEMTAGPRRPGSVARPISPRSWRMCSGVMQAIVNCPKPVIAEVTGIATAAGCQLVASCDLAVAADTAQFSTPGVHIGLFCSTPMVALSRNVTNKHAMEMLLTGDMIPAHRAAEIGLVNRVVAPEALQRGHDGDGAQDRVQIQHDTRHRKARLLRAARDDPDRGL